MNEVTTTAVKEGYCSQIRAAYISSMGWNTPELIKCNSKLIKAYVNENKGENNARTLLRDLQTGKLFVADRHSKTLKGTVTFKAQEAVIDTEKLKAYIEGKNKAIPDGTKVITQKTPTKRELAILLTKTEARLAELLSAKAEPAAAEKAE